MIQFGMLSTWTRIIVTVMLCIVWYALHRASARENTLLRIIKWVFFWNMCLWLWVSVIGMLTYYGPRGPQPDWVLKFMLSDLSSLVRIPFMLSLVWMLHYIYVLVKTRQEPKYRYLFPRKR